MSLVQDANNHFKLWLTAWVNCACFVEERSARCSPFPPFSFIPSLTILSVLLQPAGLMFSNFALGVQMDGEFVGLECPCLGGFGASVNANKLCHLSLVNPHTRHVPGHHKIHANPVNPFCSLPYSSFHTTWHLLRAMKEAGVNNHRFFVCGAFRKQTEGLICWRIDTRNRHAQESTLGCSTFPCSGTRIGHPLSV